MVTIRQMDGQILFFVVSYEWHTTQNSLYLSDCVNNGPLDRKVPNSRWSDIKKTDRFLQIV
jgi:hypothetical protein